MSWLYPLGAKVRYRDPVTDTWRPEPFRVTSRALFQRLHLGDVRTYGIEPWERTGAWASDRPHIPVMETELQPWLGGDA